MEEGLTEELTYHPRLASAVPLLHHQHYRDPHTAPMPATQLLPLEGPLIRGCNGLAAYAVPSAQPLAPLFNHTPLMLASTCLYVSWYKESARRRTASEPRW